MGVSQANFQLSIANGSGAIARKPSGGAPLGRRGITRARNFQRLISVTVSIKYLSLNLDIGDLRSGQFCDLSIIQRPAGPLDFPPPAGGGVLLRPPLYLGSWATQRHAVSGIRKSVKNYDETTSVIF